MLRCFFQGCPVPTILPACANNYGIYYKIWKIPFFCVQISDLCSVCVSSEHYSINPNLPKTHRLTCKTASNKCHQKQMRLPALWLRIDTQKAFATATKSKILTIPSPLTSGASVPRPLATATKSRTFTMPSPLISYLLVVLFR